MLGGIGQGMKIAMATLDKTRGSDVPACAVGICQNAIDLCVNYAKERKTFGRSIIENQAIQFKLADMTIHKDLLETAHRDAQMILNIDTNLQTPRGKALRTLLYLFEQDEALKTYISG